ncbi:hypothetical protein [Nocardia bovistercoris]|uniref:Uncharacterized protein n=1 Tax=Nocardia bovistercoris TaxID=2785916 RepID=A0A931N527_9NOCA|nr:hypothetical protein [Nocardia bovistercoris]MBH0779317.1 hypothetical protein [Nocardia bovistercoris]
MTQSVEGDSRPNPEALVVVYAVGETGATADLLGRATLINRQFALVSEPLNRVLAEHPRRMRVGVFAARHAYQKAPKVTTCGEIIDVAFTRVVEEDRELVLLDLAVESAAPVLLPFLVPPREDIVAALRGVLDGNPLSAPHIGDPADPVAVFRKVMGWDR